MKPATFEYEAPRTTGEALRLLAAGGDDAKLLAGGQSLVPMMSFRLVRPALLIDLNGVAGLDRVGVEDGELRVGSLVRHRRLERDTSGDAAGRLLAWAARNVGHLPIRMRGTIGGSLAHADPAAELCLLATALDARIALESPRGTRVVGADDFFRSVFVTALEPDELIAEVRFPLLGPHAGVGFAEFSRREGDFAIVAAAVALIRDGRTIRRAMIGLGGVGSRPVRAREAEDLLRGAEPGADAFEAAAALAAGGVAPMADVHGSADYRRHLVHELTRRALELADEQGGAQPMTRDVTLTINGRSYPVSVEPRRTLADAIREDCGLTGTHLGCEHGVCGACTVVVDGAPVRSCLVFAVQCEGAEIATVEGLSAGGELHPLQAAFKRHHGLQCGFCTPGFLMLAAALLEEDPAIGDEDLMAALSSNICRCTGYQNIIAAVREAARELAPDAG